MRAVRLCLIHVYRMMQSQTAPVHSPPCDVRLRGVRRKARERRASRASRVTETAGPNPSAEASADGRVPDGDSGAQRSPDARADEWNPQTGSDAELPHVSERLHVIPAQEMVHLVAPVTVSTNARHVIAGSAISLLRRKQRTDSVPLRLIARDQGVVKHVPSPALAPPPRARSHLPHRRCREHSVHEPVATERLVAIHGTLVDEPSRVIAASSKDAAPQVFAADDKSRVRNEQLDDFIRRRGILYEWNKQLRDEFFANSSFQALGV